MFKFDFNMVESNNGREGGGDSGKKMKGIKKSLSLKF
jgi:hypothetical protein